MSGSFTSRWLRRGAAAPTTVTPATVTPGADATPTDPMQTTGAQAEATLSDDDLLLRRHPRVLRCAALWASRLVAAHITTHSDEDLIHEAWPRVEAKRREGTVANPVAYLCQAITNEARALLRRTERQIATDPAEAVLAQLPARSRGFDEVDLRDLVDRTLAWLDAERPALTERMLRDLGDLDARVNAIWHAARLAVPRLLHWEPGEAGGLREVLQQALADSDEWFRGDQQDGELTAHARDRRRKRTARSLPSLSYILLWETLRYLYADHPRVQRALAEQHLGFIAILREGGNPQRLAAIEAHIATVAAAAGRPPSH